MTSKEKSTQIIYLFGHPGTGKYSISQQLAKKGYIICDNQLVNNPIFSLLNYNGYGDIPQIGWNAIGQIRDSVLDFISKELSNSYVLTNCLYDNEGDRRCYLQVESIALKRKSVFVPVKLLISKEENLKRITKPSRRKRWKSIDPQDVYSRGQLLNVKHPNLLELDVSHLSAAYAASKILDHVKMMK